MTSLLAYFRSLGAKFFRRAETEREMEEELRAHLRHRVDHLQRSGMDQPEAERRAQTRLETTAGRNLLTVRLRHGRWKLSATA